MKRAIVSIICGIVFPIVYTILIGSIASAFPEYGLGTMHVNGTPVPGLIFAPTMLPVYITQLLQSNAYFGMRFSLDNPSFRITFFILFNVVLYSALTYLSLRWVGWFRR